MASDDDPLRLNERVISAVKSVEKLSSGTDGTDDSGTETVSEGNELRTDAGDKRDTPSQVERTSSAVDDGRVSPLISRRGVLGGTAAGLLAMVPLSAGATTGSSFKAVQDGAWSDPGTWEEGEVPTDGAHVSIPDGVAVTVTERVDTRIKYVSVSGTLRHAPDRDTLFRAETIHTMAGSRYEIGTSSTPVQQGVTAEVEFIDEGPIDEDRWPDRKNKGLIGAAEVEIVGARKTPWTVLGGHATAGDATIELSSEPANWNEGDRLLFPGLDYYTSTDLDHDDEERSIESVDGTTVTLDAPLDHDHIPPKSGLDSYVLNLTRNVVLSSENTDEHRRGHVMLMNTGTDVRYVRFDELGRTNKDRPITNPVRNADQVDADEPNPAARYALHWHHTGIDADQPHNVEGVVVDGSPGWGIVNHHAYAHVSDSITYGVRGAGFVAEGGNERGSYDNCIAVRSDGSGDPVDSRSAGAHGGDPPIDDFGHAGHGFWLQSPLVSVTNCVAAGHRHQAFVWWLRQLLDGDMAEGTTIDDSRVTYHPNLPLEYVDTDRIAPLLEAIEQGRFENEDVMQETNKIPSTFAPLADVRGNVAFASAGGVDFSRHNFKWKHERFSDFNTLDDMTVHSIGPFIDASGTVHEPDLPRHRASGHQGRGGSTGVSFRYTSNVSLTDSHIVGVGREDSVGIPFHDYQWTNVIDNCTVENWDWGIGAGEHRLDWIRNCDFSDNAYDVAWVFDNVGPAVLDNNNLNSVRHKFVPFNQKAADVLTFGQSRGVRIDGRSSHVADSAPDYVPFPDQDSLDGLNNIEDIDAVDDETDLVGLTNQDMYDQFGICIGGRPMPDDATAVDYVDDGHLDPEGGRDPATSVHLDATQADPLGMFDVVSNQDVSGGQCLQSVGTDSPKENPASLTFNCAAGTYELYFRFQPAAWNGDDIYYRIDGGDWYTAEKLKDPASPSWHSASPNGGSNYEHDLSEGQHTLEFATDGSGRLIDEIFIGSDGAVLGAYGMSQSEESTDAAPAVDSLSVSEVETKNADAEFDVSWDVSDDDGDLTDVSLTLVQDADDDTEDMASLSVSGSSASGTTRLVAADDDGTGNSYTVDATVTDSAGGTDSATASVTESENEPAFDELSLSEVETDNSDAEFDASWAVSDGDGDLSSVDLTLADDTDGETEDTVSLSVSGDTASGTTRLVAAGDDGTGNSYTVKATVTDSFEQTDSATASATAALENESPPTVDGVKWTTVEAGTVSLTAGTHTIRLAANGDDFNVNWFGFEQSDSQTDGQSPYTDHDLSQVEAEDFDTGGEGVAYHDTSDGNKGGAYRDTDVDIEEADDVSGAYNLAWIREGEWWEYTVEVPEDGEYDLVARLAGKRDTSLDVAVDGSQVATVDVPDTGHWQEWTTVEAGTVSLTAGTHTIRLTANGEKFNINWFGFQ